MQKYATFANETLKKAGYKLSKPRQVIINLLAQSNKALTPYEMRDVLHQQKIKADIVTIYRVLELLEKLALAHKVLGFNGYIRCSMEEDSHIHPVQRAHGCRSDGTPILSEAAQSAQETALPAPSLQKSACHHYILCKKCHKVEEVEGEDLSTIEKNITKNSGFHIDSHYLEFKGLCQNCCKQ